MLFKNCICTRIRWLHFSRNLTTLFAIRMNYGYRCCYHQLAHPTVVELSAQVLVAIIESAKSSKIELVTPTNPKIWVIVVWIILVRAILAKSGVLKRIFTMNISSCSVSDIFPLGYLDTTLNMLLKHVACLPPSSQDLANENYISRERAE